MTNLAPIACLPFTRSSTLGATQQLVVYPRLVPLERLGLPAGFPLGERKPDRWIFEDPSRPAGVRDYRREDPFRHIHWKATARRQQLQVKLHEPTTTLETALFLGVDSFGVDSASDGATEGRTQIQGSISALGPRDPELTFEYAVSVTASLAHRLIGRRHPVGLYLNGDGAGSGDPVDLAPGASQEQLMQILELLAGVNSVASCPVEVLLARVAPRLPWGASAIVVLGSLPEPLAAALERLAQSGRKPVVLLIGKGACGRAPEGVDLHRLQPAPEDLKEIQLAPTALKG